MGIRLVLAEARGEGMEEEEGMYSGLFRRGILRRWIVDGVGRGRVGLGIRLQVGTEGDIAWVGMRGGMRRNGGVRDGCMRGVGGCNVMSGDERG